MDYQPLFVMRIYSHFFKILRPTPRVRYLLQQYLFKYTSKTLTKEKGRWLTKPDKLYGVKSLDGNEYRLHINQLEEFKNMLFQNHITEALYETEHVPLPTFQPIELEVREGWVPRDYQVPAIDYILEDNGNNSKMLALKTGEGKTSISLFALAKLKYRTIILIKPTYIEKWVSDLRTILNVDLKDIMVIQGGDHMRGLFHLANNGKLDAKFIIISNRTYQNYLKSFETDPDSFESLNYECHPDAMYELLRVSELLIDEVHQEFHSCYRAILYANVHTVITLSATLLSHDPFMTRMYETAFPGRLRYAVETGEKYLKMFPVSYMFKEPQRIRTSEFGQSNYSHIAFEKSIMYRPHVLRPYMEMINFIVEIGYIREYQPNDKILIFASSIAMCTELTRFFKQKYPGKDVRRYVEDDPYENVMEADICISTILSSGTALDIPNLRAVILTINIMSAQSNVQGAGRLRKLKDRDVKFYYLYCTQLEKHKEYHQKRLALMRDRVLLVKDTPYGKPI